MALCVYEKLELIELIEFNFLLSRLVDHGEEECKRHNLALQRFQRERNEWNKCKAQKAKMKEELMPIAWHPSRRWDWCVPKDEKRETEKIFFDHLIC